MDLLEFFGTLFTIIFDIVYILFVYLFFARGIAPMAVAIAVTVVFGIAAIYLTYRVGRFWVERFKRHFGKGK